MTKITVEQIRRKELAVLRQHEVVKEQLNQLYSKIVSSNDSELEQLAKQKSDLEERSRVLLDLHAALVYLKGDVERSTRIAAELAERERKEKLIKKIKTPACSICSCNDFVVRDTLAKGFLAKGSPKVDWAPGVNWGVQVEDWHSWSLPFTCNNPAHFPHSIAVYPDAPTLAEKIEQLDDYST